MEIVASLFPEDFKERAGKKYLVDDLNDFYEHC